MKRIHVQYFAVFRERRGLGEEIIEIDAATARDLYAHLAAQYSFPLPEHSVRVSVNLSFTPMDTPVHDGDRVVFIPPVAGG